MSFEEKYEKGVDLYKQRIREYDALIRRRGRSTVTYDPDRRVEFLDPNHHLSSNAEYIRNTNIYNLYNRVATKKYTDMREIERDLDRIALERFQVIEQPDKSISLGEVKGVVRDHSEAGMRQEMEIDRARDVLNRMEGTVSVEELLALAGLTED